MADRIAVRLALLRGGISVASRRLVATTPGSAAGSGYYYGVSATQVLLEALERLPDPAWCEGRRVVRGPLEIALPGAVLALDAPDLVTRLLRDSEPAPFGDATGTRHDTAVRDTRRLTARAATKINFDPSSILREIEQALGTDCELATELLDVLVYVPGSRFLEHKDTPRYDDQLGTLIVELPHAHRGGALQLADGERAATIDWSGEADPDVVRWVAMFGDVDHEITPVTEGMRITAVYTLRHREERLPSPHRDRVDTIIDAAIGLYDDMPGGDTLAIPCGRMIVAPRDITVLTHAVLRGADRLIAAALERAGMKVSVRTCLIVAWNENTPLPEAIKEAESYRRAVLLRNAIPDEVLSASDAISWDPEPEGYEHTIAAVASYVDLAEKFPSCTWLVRAQVPMFQKDMAYSATGYFGNEYSQYYVYQFAAMLVDVPAEWDRQ